MCDRPGVGRHQGQACAARLRPLCNAWHGDPWDPPGGAKERGMWCAHAVHKSLNDVVWEMPWSCRFDDFLYSLRGEVGLSLFGGWGQGSPQKPGWGVGQGAPLTYTIVTIEKKLTIHLWQGLCTSDFVPLLGTPRRWGDVAILPTCGP